MSGGDTLIVHSGLYAEGNITLPSGSASAPTTIKANPGDTVTLQPNNSSIDQIIWLRTGQSYITIDGLILDAGSPSGTRLSFAAVVNEDHNSATGHHFTIQNCEVKNGKQQGLHIAGGNWTVKNNNIHHNGTDPQLHHGIYLAAWDSLVQGNNMHDNKCFSLQNYSATEQTKTNNNTFLDNISTQNGCGIVIAQGSGHFVANNVIHHDATRGVGAGAFICCGDNSRQYHNTIANNFSVGMGSYSGAYYDAAQIRNNIICGNSGGNLTGSGGTRSDNISSSSCPAFVDGSNGNYHLSSGSSAINAAPCLGSVTTDHDGNPRPVGASCAIGAYEFGSVPGPEVATVPAPRNLRAVRQP
jgi:hypothetical protein